LQTVEEIINLKDLQLITKGIIE